MISDLPSPDHARLANAPLEVVVWQLQFAEPTDVSGARVGQQVADALSAGGRGHVRLTRINAPTVTFAVGGAGGPPMPGGPIAGLPLPGVQLGQPGGLASGGWQIRAEELVATVNQAGLTIETTAYDVWDSFRASIVAILDGFASAAPQTLGEQRLGLRFIDRISRPEVSRVADWAGWIEPWLLGPVTHPQIGEAIAASAQQIDCDAGNGLNLTLRQRAFVDPERRNRHTMILDLDAFREGYRAFEREAVLTATDALSDISHRVFRAAITDQLYDALREEPEAK